jgi:hypothetical protein
VGILQKMQACRNVVRLLGCFEAANEVMVVTDLCSGGDLQKLSDVSLLLCDLVAAVAVVACPWLRCSVVRQARRCCRNVSVGADCLPRLLGGACVCPPCRTMARCQSVPWR